ncbi:MFS general substrate transporter like protein [Babesia gibsoni]|uniref:Hexose transporter 1 n=1 Tax=Babesia gibsoni TaxID=33632 RepID=A0AAD8PDC1_BABGI|nr:MFS general substrate transporter like protein [Babesia gibsoni]
MLPYFPSSIAVGALAAMCFGANVVNLSLSKEFTIADFNWCDGEASKLSCPKGDLYGSLIGGGVFLGAALGSCFISIAGKIGRRKAMLLLHALNIAGSLISGGSMCFTMLLLGRFICGIAVGMCGVAPVFLTEVSPSEKRGIIGLAYPVFLVMGQVLMIMWQLLHGRIPVDEENNRFELTNLDRVVWRMAQLWPVVISVAAVFLLLFVVKYDTPHFLLQEGKDEEAVAATKALHGEEKFNEAMKEIKADVEAQKQAGATLGLVAAMKVPKFRKTILILVGFSIMQQTSGINVFVSNASKIFVSIMGRTFASNLLGTATVGVLFVATAFTGFVIDKFGRKTLLLFGIAFSCLSMIPAVIAKLACEPSDAVNIGLAIGCMGFTAGFAVGFGGCMFLYLAEAFGSEYKDAGFSLAICMNWIAAFIMVATSDFLLAWNDNFTYVMYTAFSVVGLVYVAVFLKETKGIPLGQAYA